MPATEPPNTTQANADLIDAINRLGATRTKDEAVQHAINTTAALLRLWVAEHFADIKQRNRTLEAVLTAARRVVAHRHTWWADNSQAADRQMDALEQTVRDADAHRGPDHE